MGRKDRLIERTLHPGLELAVDIGVGVYGLALGAASVNGAHELDGGLCQRSGLVGAQYIHGAEIVDCGQTLHDHLPLGQLQCRPRQRHGHDHRQQFRRQPDGQRQREHQRLQHRTVK